MKITLAVVSVWGLCALSCAQLQSTSVAPTVSRAGIYQRATNQFELADFYKPAESKTNDPAYTLAPLILQEVAGAGDPFSRPDRFGTLSLSNGLRVLDRSRPSVYWYADTVTLSGKAHARLAYFWFYSLGTARSDSAPRLEPSNQRRGSLSVQGVRITLNSAGQPVIWEVLTDGSGTRVMFASQGLEAAAAARFGKALPGRRYAIERSITEAPDVIVARVIDDGPVAMGPIVYLSGGTHSVSTLICRCMPAQLKTLRTTAIYDLLPLPDIPRDVHPPTRGLWPGDTASGKRLGDRLRLPDF